MIHKAILVFALLFSSGCSVFMAGTGSDPVDFEQIYVGADRAQVEEVLGRPIEFYRQAGRDFAAYQILTNDKADLGRAATYAVLSGVTLGLAEFVTFPLEALQGEQNRIEVYYTPHGKVISFKHIVSNSPVRNPTEVFNETVYGKEKQVES